MDDCTEAARMKRKASVARMERSEIRDRSSRRRPAFRYAPCGLPLPADLKDFSWG